MKSNGIIEAFLTILGAAEDRERERERDRERQRERERETERERERERTAESYFLLQRVTKAFLCS